MGESYLTIIFPYHHGCKMGIFPWQTPKIREITWSLGGTGTWDLSDVAEFILPWTSMGHRKHHRGDGHWIARPVGAMRGAHWVTLFRHSQKPSLVLQFLLKASSFRETYTASILGPWYPMISHHPIALIFDLHLHRHICGCNSLLKWAAGDMGWTSESCLKGSLPEKETHGWLWTIVPWIFHSTHWHGKFSTFKWAGLKTLFASNQGVDTDMKTMCLVIEKEVETVLGEQQYKRDNCHMSYIYIYL